MSGESFVRRWSRLKGASAHDKTAAPVEAPAPAAGAEPVAPAMAAETPAVPVEIPDLESLGPDSDYTAFLQDSVPDALRNAALRKLWASNPVFSIIDGLDEYDGDYSLVGMIDEHIETAYKVGRGFRQEDEEAEEDAVAEDGDGLPEGAAETGAPEAAEDGDQAPSAADGAADGDTPAGAGPPDAKTPDVAADSEDSVGPIERTESTSIRTGRPS